MARPRFGKLPIRQQQAILAAALAEFATHGYATASLNRIIDTAGISKGSMYYYFDGKADLYAHVLRVELERLFERGGPFPVPAARDPDVFWSQLEDHYLRLMRLLDSAPELGALLRDWLTGQAPPPVGEALHDAEQAAMPWLSRTLEAGQQIGAVRTDVPADLLIGVVMGMGQAMDTWLITRPPADTALPEATRTLLDMVRRAIGP